MLGALVNSKEPMLLLTHVITLKKALYLHVSEKVCLLNNSFLQAIFKVTSLSYDIPV